MADQAPGWPGIEARWTSSAKCGVGTALGASGAGNDSDGRPRACCAGSGIPGLFKFCCHHPGALQRALGYGFSA